MVGLGTWELVLIVAIGGGLCFGIACLGVVVAVARRANSTGSTGRWQPPTPAGEPVRIRALDLSDRPIDASATWNGAELVVSAEKGTAVHLFDVALDRAEQSMITYRFRIKTENLQNAVYPEMWCHVDGKGKFFSRGLDRKVRGTNDWPLVEIPFFLESGQRASLLNLNLVFEGAGAVRLKEIEVLSTPVNRSP